MSKRNRKNKKQNGDKAMTEKYDADGMIIPETGEVTGQVTGEVETPPTSETQTADKPPETEAAPDAPAAEPVQKNRPKRSIPGASKFVECQNIALESFVLSPIKNRCGNLRGAPDRSEAIKLCDAAVREFRAATDKANTMGRMMAGLIEAGFVLPVIRIAAFIKAAPGGEPIDIEELRKAAYGREA